VIFGIGIYAITASCIRDQCGFAGTLEPFPTRGSEIGERVTSARQAPSSFCKGRDAEPLEPRSKAGAAKLNLCPVVPALFTYLTDKNKTRLKFLDFSYKS